MPHYRLADAMSAARLAKESAPDEVGVCYQLGALLLDDGQIDAAVTELKRAHELGGARYGAAEKLGVALIKSGRPQEAVPCLEEAVALRLKTSKASRYLAEAYAAAGDLEKAVEFLINTAIPSAEKKASLAFAAARLLFKLGRIEEADKIIEIAILERPDVEKFAALRRQIAQSQPVH